MSGWAYGILILTIALHVGFMGGETIRWSNPVLLKKLSREKLESKGESFSTEQRKFVADIVKNAGIYNGIVAAGLAYAACTGDVGAARVLLAGATVAGLFGAITLTPWTLLQAGLGIAGLVALPINPA
jgi:uncharacterized membrane protein